MARIVIFGDFWPDGQGHFFQPGKGWDGITRAFNHFGHEYLAINMRDKKLTFPKIAERVLLFMPQVWWIRIKEGLAFLAWWSHQGYPRPEKVVYHFCDLRAPEGVSSIWPVKEPVIDPSKVHGLIDVLFLANSGQLAEYQEAYQIPRGYFLPHFYVPEVLYPIETQKRYDIGFVGAIDFSIYHYDRTKLLIALKDIYGDRLAVRERGVWGKNLALFYSQCKIVLGPGCGLNVRHNTSDRFVLALGCGAFYLYQYFAGAEDLMPPTTAIPWHTQDMLCHLIDFYVDNDESTRQVIARRGLALAIERYTHVQVIGKALSLLGMR